MRNLKSTTLLFELSKPGRRAAVLPACDVPTVALDEILPGDAELPQIVLQTANGERPVRSGAFDHFA